MKISFTCYVHPEPQGSTRAFIPKGSNRVIITSANKKLKPFRQQVAVAALDAMAEFGGQPERAGTPIHLYVAFYFARPKSAKKRVHPAVRPDLDKLVRGLLDSLTGIVYEDDAQVCVICAEKRYGQPERLEVAVRNLDEEPERQNDEAGTEDLSALPAAGSAKGENLPSLRSSTEARRARRIVRWQTA